MSARGLQSPRPAPGSPASGVNRPEIREAAGINEFYRVRET
jgi:hypothetical protein